MVSRGGPRQWADLGLVSTMFGPDMACGTGLPAPEALGDEVDFAVVHYLNHPVVNGVIACGYGDERAEARVRDLLAEAYRLFFAVVLGSR